MKSIVILRDRPSKPMDYGIDHYALRWRNSGYRVIDHVGVLDVPVADIVIVHVDLTVVPRAYVDSIRGSPTVINGKALDISRRRYSQLLLSREDSWSGPVIVKTNANHGGIPERRMHRREQRRSGRGSRATLLSLPLRYLFGRTNSGIPAWRMLESMDPLAYPIFRDITCVPPGVWENDNLVVERFVSSGHGDLSCVYYCCFFGDKLVAGRLHSRSQIVKFGNSVSDEELPVPDEVMRWRVEIEIDYGRFDYVEVAGKYYLIDVNKTEGFSPTDFDSQDELDFLASGLQ